MMLSYGTLTDMVVHGIVIGPEIRIAVGTTGTLKHVSRDPPFR